MVAEERWQARAGHGFRRPCAQRLGWIPPYRSDFYRRNDPVCKRSSELLLRSIVTTPFLHSSSISFNSVYYFQFDGNEAQEDVDKFMDGRSKIMLGEEQKGSDSESEEEIDVVRSSLIRSVCSSYHTCIYHIFLRAHVLAWTVGGV
jgi:hypothetical protein